MPRPGPSASRRHLSLVGQDAGWRRDESRALLALRGALATLALLVLTLAAAVRATAALAPLGWRRAPNGRRLRRPSAQVIPFQPRRAVPR